MEYHFTAPAMNEKRRKLAEKTMTLLLSSHLIVSRMLKEKAFNQQEQMLLYSHYFVHIDNSLQELGFNGSPDLLPLKAYFRTDCQTLYQYLLHEFQLILIVYSSEDQEQEQNLVSLVAAHDLAKQEAENNHLNFKKLKSRFL